MSVIVDRKFIVKANDGKQYLFSQEEIDGMTTETNILIQCDGPKCASRNGLDSPRQVFWNQEEVQQNADKMPDDFFRIFKIGINPGNPIEVPFCGPQCAKDYIQYSYTPPKSPRETAAQAKQELTDRLKELNPHLTSLADGAVCESVQKTDNSDLRKVVVNNENIPEWVPDQEANAVIDSLAIDPVEDATGYSEGVPV